MKVLFSFPFYSQCNVRRLVFLLNDIFVSFTGAFTKIAKSDWASWLDGCLAAYNSAANTGRIFLKFSISDYYEICQDASNSVKIGQKHRPFCMNTWECFLLLEAQQYGERIVVLPWQRFKYLLYCWQRRVCDNNTKGTHCCLSTTKIVGRTGHNIV